MKKLTDDLKRALNALACQHAGDYLPMTDKMDSLGLGKTRKNKRRRKPLVQRTAPPVRRMALLHDGEMQDTTLEFAIDAARRQGQPIQIDLLLHGDRNAEQRDAVTSRIAQAGVDVQLVDLQPPASASIIDYLKNQTQLISLVARPDDALARMLTEKVMPGSGERLYVPIVLVGANKPRSELREQSAA